MRHNFAWSKQRVTGWPILACRICGVILYEVPDHADPKWDGCPEEDNPLGAPPPEGDQSGREYEKEKK